MEQNVKVNFGKENHFQRINPNNPITAPITNKNKPKIKHKTFMTMCISGLFSMSVPHLFNLCLADTKKSTEDIHNLHHNLPWDASSNCFSDLVEFRILKEVVQRSSDKKA